MRSPPPTPGAQPRDTQGPSEAEPSTGELSGLRVLVADDSAMNRRIIATFMERAGAEVDAVDGGAGAVEAGLGRHYDCILMDIRMPDMSGPEALRALRKGGCESPIIAVTAENAPNAVPQYQQAGFADVVFKPTPTARLVALIQHHVGRGAEAAPTPAPESTAEPSPRQEPDTDPDAAPDAAPDAPVDTERAIRAAGGNAAFAAKLYAEFMDELRRQCDSLAQASAQDLAEIAHRIAGGARYCGAGRLEAAALSSEHAAQTADDGASVERARSTLREAVERQLALPDPYASRD
jgi:two-component system sensor histidine kinase BarA